MSLAQDYLSRLKNRPSDENSSVWADYLELVCLANIDGEVSDSDIIDRLNIRLRDLNEGPSNILLDDDENLDNISYATNRSRISDRWETKLSDWFKILSMRSSLYGEFYPFTVTSHELKIKRQRLSLKQKFYLHLLLCSNLYLFNSTNSNALTNSFEQLSFKTFQNVLPNNAVVHIFGKSQSNNRGPFRGRLSFWKKINNLVDLVNENLSPRMLEADYPPNNTGDGGLDLVAWIPTGDKLSSNIIFLAQCACGEDWPKKVHESSVDDWSARIDFTNYTLNNIFIPYCFRQSNGSWIRAADIKKSFLLDRKRIIEFAFKNRIVNFNSLPAAHIINEVFVLKESTI